MNPYIYPLSDAMGKLFKYIFTVFILLNIISMDAQFYNGTQMEFGKNRVQYREFDWFYYPYERFEVYHYKGGDELAKYTALSAEKSLKEIETFLDFRVKDKVQILCFNKQSEFRQSNIGITEDDNTNIGGSTQIIGSKVFIYYETDHKQLDRQIKSSLGDMVIKNMMYGGDWKEVWKSSSLLNIPEWYDKGIVSYMTNKWDSETESIVKAKFENGAFERFNDLTGIDSQYAGHSLWKYLADVYGESVIPNVLYMTKVSRNIESGFILVLGVSLETLLEDYNKYYNNYFIQRGKFDGIPSIEPEYTGKQLLSFKGNKGDAKKSKLNAKILGELPIKSKSRYTYSQMKKSPDGQSVSFATNEMGQYKIWLYNLQTGKLKRIFKKEYKLERIIDNTFPILTWHPTSSALTFTYEDKGRAFIGNYYLEDKKTTVKELFRIDKVIDFSYSDDGRQMIFTGVREGQTDLYLYQVIGNNQRQLTNDIYDDVDARFIRNSEAVIFASNRPDDTLRTNVDVQLFNQNKDIFIMDLVRDTDILEQITNTPGADESNPFDYIDGRNYTFLSNQYGFVNRYTAFIDSSILKIDTIVHYQYFTVAQPVSDFGLNPLEYDFNPKTGDYSLLFYKDGKYQWYSGKREDDNNTGAFDPLIGEMGGSGTARFGNQEVLIQERKEEEFEVDINNFEFESDKKKKKDDQEITQRTDLKNNELVTTDSTYVFPKSRNYRLNFATDEVLSQIDNTFNNRFYQNLTGPNSLYPGLSGMFQVAMSDLFEDYKLVGGIRLAGNLQNLDIGLSYLNLKKQIDKKVTLQRQSQRILGATSFVKLQTYSGEYQMSKPINELMALKGSLMFRNDRAIFLSTDPRNLAEPNQQFSTTGLKFEFVFDNTLAKGLNLYNGTRFKIWAEYYQDLRYKQLNSEDPDNSKLFIFEDQTDFKVVGFDFRHYQKIHRNMIVALRAAGSTSFGSQKLLYFMGGVDNWLFQRVNDNNDWDPNQNYVFQAMSTPVRGFWLNTRNGNSMALVNAELRWPIFKYFMNKPIKSDFLENFQVVGFTDVGSAWTGRSPYSEDNFFNSQSFLDSAPVTVTIQNNREPIIYGYGFGLRSRVLGYFLRADWSWGVDDNVVLPRVFSLSLSLDF